MCGSISFKVSKDEFEIKKIVVKEWPSPQSGSQLPGSFVEETAPTIILSSIYTAKHVLIVNGATLRRKEMESR